MGSGSSKSEEKVVQVKPVVVEKPKFTYKKTMPTRPESSASEDSTKEPEKPKGTPPPPVVKWEEILAQHDQEEEEPEREQFVAPRATFPIGIGPYASLGKPRKRPETKLKKRKTPKPEPKTVEELLMTDSEEEEDEEEEVEEESKELENISVPRPKTNQAETRATTVITVVNNEDNSADDDDDSDIEFGSQFSGLNTVYSGPDVLFVAPETNMPSKEIVDQGKHQYAYGTYLLQTRL
ncbi:nucleolin-like isoform X2 [Argopecten irradians]|uniref:nucleolin-like isoform X2 n=1 Tax=Argopecten irradians TaxID=31199 RepID=UPI003719935E